MLFGEVHVSRPFVRRDAVFAGADEIAHAAAELGRIHGRIGIGLEPLLAVKFPRGTGELGRPPFAGLPCPAVERYGGENV